MIKALKSVPQLFAVRTNTYKNFRFLFYSFGFSFLLLLAFLTNAGVADGTVSRLYSLTIPLYYYLIFAFVSLLVLPCIWVKPLGALIVLPKIAFDIVLIGDYFLFGVYRFHVDMMFINMLIYDFKGIGISYGLVLLSLFVASLVAAINVWIYRKLDNWPRLPLVKVNLAIFLVFLAGQMVHVVGYDYREAKITKYTPYFPYYAPLTSYKLMTELKAKYPETFPTLAQTGSGAVEGILTGSEQGLLTYPKSPLSCAIGEGKKAPNILIFVAESWRQDVMDAEVTPNIYQFAQEGIEYTNHYSGGSVTVNGLFSLMYGLHPTYRDYMTSDPLKHQTLLTKTLAERGYDIDVYTSSNLDRFSLKAMFFGKISDDNYINPHGGALKDDDFKAVTELLVDLKKPSAKPWFKFVFLSSSHHNYQYPDEYELYTPVETNPEKFLFNKNMDPVPLFNKYRNSVHYIDGLFGRIWQVMARHQDIDNTLSIVTSDHGEEFNDNQLGFWGHGNNFTQPQIAVPMLMRLPRAEESAPKPSKISRLSGHIDVVPTIFQQALGCNNPISDYSVGENLLDLPEKRAGLITASYKDKAYLIDETVYATGLSVDSYSVFDLKNKNKNYDYSGLNELKQQESSLLKR